MLSSTEAGPRDRILDDYLENFLPPSTGGANRESRSHRWGSFPGTPRSAHRGRDRRQRGFVRCSNQARILALGQGHRRGQTVTAERGPAVDRDADLGDILRGDRGSARPGDLLLCLRIRGILGKRGGDEEAGLPSAEHHPALPPRQRKKCCTFAVTLCHFWL
jgi:hypothetical protein